MGMTEKRQLEQNGAIKVAFPVFDEWAVMNIDEREVSGRETVLMTLWNGGKWRWDIFLFFLWRLPSFLSMRLALRDRVRSLSYAF